MKTLVIAAVVPFLPLGQQAEQAHINYHEAKLVETKQAMDEVEFGSEAHQRLTERALDQIRALSELREDER